MRILFITNFCPHYHVKPFEELSKRFNIDYIFFSKGENYHNGKNTADNLQFKHSFLLPGISRPIQWYKIIKDGHYDVIVKCVTGGYLTIYTFILSKLFGSRFIFWSNIWHYGNNFRSLIARFIHFFLYKHSDAIVTYGEHIDAFIIKNITDINPLRIFHSYNVVDNSLFEKKISKKEIEELKAKYDIKGKRILLFVGRITKEKGFNYLLDAYKNLEQKYCNISLLIIGDDLNKLNENIKSIINIGRVENSELYKYYLLADIFILPSITSKKWKEPWGLVVNEAMNCGCAIIATDAVGATGGGLLKDKITGYVVREQDSNALENAIEKLLSNEELLKEIQIRNEKIIKIFDEKLFAKGFQEAFEYVSNK